MSRFDELADEIEEVPEPAPEPSRFDQLADDDDSSAESSRFDQLVDDEPSRFDTLAGEPEVTPVELTPEEPEPEPEWEHFNPLIAAHTSHYQALERMEAKDNRTDYAKWKDAVTDDMEDAQARDWLRVHTLTEGPGKGMLLVRDRIAIRDEYIDKYGELPPSMLAQRPLRPGEQLPLAKTFDRIEFGATMIGFVNKRMATVARPIAAIAHATADIRSLAEATPQERYAFLDEFTDQDPLKEEYRYIIEQLNTGVPREEIEGFLAVTAKYFLPNEADPWAGTGRPDFYGDAPDDIGTVFRRGVVEPLMEKEAQLHVDSHIKGAKLLKFLAPDGMLPQGVIDLAEISPSDRQKKIEETWGGGEYLDAQRAEARLLTSQIGEETFNPATAEAAMKTPGVMFRTAWNVVVGKEDQGLIKNPIPALKEGGAELRDLWEGAARERTMLRPTRVERVMVEGSTSGRTPTNIALYGADYYGGGGGATVKTAAGVMTEDGARRYTTHRGGTVSDALEAVGLIRTAEKGEEGAHWTLRMPEAPEERTHVLELARELEIALDSATARAGTLAEESGKRVHDINLRRLVKIDDEGDLVIDTSDQAIRLATIQAPAKKPWLSKDTSVHAPTSTLGKAVESAVMAELPGGGRLLPNWAIGRVERLRRTVGKGRPYAVWHKNEKGKDVLKPLDAVDLIGRHEWEHMKSLRDRSRFSEEALRSRVSAAVSNLIQGTDSKAQRELVADLLESMGRKRLPKSDLAMELLDELSKRMDKAVEWKPTKTRVGARGTLHVALADFDQLVAKGASEADLMEQRRKIADAAAELGEAEGDPALARFFDRADDVSDADLTHHRDSIEGGVRQLYGEGVGDLGRVPTADDAVARLRGNFDGDDARFAANLERSPRKMEREGFKAVEGGYAPIDAAYVKKLRRELKDRTKRLKKWEQQVASTGRIEGIDIGLAGSHKTVLKEERRTVQLRLPNRIEEAKKWARDHKRLPPGTPKKSTAQAYIELLDARARTWAAVTGGRVDEYFWTRFSKIAEFEAYDQFADEVGRETMVLFHEDQVGPWLYGKMADMVRAEFTGEGRRMTLTAWRNWLSRRGFQVEGTQVEDLLNAWRRSGVHLRHSLDVLRRNESAFRAGDEVLLEADDEWLRENVTRLGFAEQVRYLEESLAAHRRPSDVMLLAHLDGFARQLVEVPLTGFRRVLPEAIQNAPFESGSPAQWRQYLKKQRGAGLKQEELDTSLIDSYIGKLSPEDAAMMGPVKWTKDDLLELIEPPDTGEMMRRSDMAQTNWGREDYFDEVLELPGGTNYRELTLSYKDNWGQRFDATHYWPNHPNVVVNMRFNDRVIDGKRTLFIEELQSDWHQAGQRQGYLKPGETQEGLEEWLAGLKAGKAGKAPSDLALMEQIAEQALDGTPLAGRPVPDAPWKGTWHQLALKRMVRLAAEEGYDQIAWTTGKQQIDRYPWVQEGAGAAGLRQHYDKVLPGAAKKLYKKYGATPARIQATAVEAATEVPQQLRALKQTLSAQPVWSQGQRSDLHQVLQLMGDEYRLAKMAQETGLEGEITLALLLDAARRRAPRASEMVIGEIRSRVTRPDRLAELGIEVPIDGHAMPITPELRAAVMEGQALFQKGPKGEARGAVAFVADQDGKAVIAAFKGSKDVSTLAHELGHVFRRDLGVGDQRLADKWVTDKLGKKAIEDGKWSREAEEMFADGFVRWLREGKVPIEGLKDLFINFGHWLKSLYSAAMVRGLAEPNKDLEEVFGRLFDPDQAYDQLRPLAEGGAPLSKAQGTRGLHRMQRASGGGIKMEKVPGKAAPKGVPRFPNGEIPAAAAGRPLDAWASDIAAKGVQGKTNAELLKSDTYNPQAVGEALQESYLELLDRQASKAQEVRNVIRELTSDMDANFPGVGDRYELEALRKVGQEIDDVLARVDAFKAEDELLDAYAAASVSDVRTAARAVGTDAKVPDELRPIVDQARQFFDGMYDELKKSGALPDWWTKEVFFERMRVGGYVHHMLSEQAQLKMGQLKTKYRGAELDTRIRATMHRGHTGTLAENNERVRREIGAMILESAQGISKPTDAQLADVIKANGLDQIQWFERDLATIMLEYGNQVAGTVTNRAFLKRMEAAFPQGDYFSRLAGDSIRDPAKLKPGERMVPRDHRKYTLVDVDTMAAEQGFRRLSGVERLKSVMGHERVWDGWNKYRDEIQKLLVGMPPGPGRKSALMDFLRRNGVPIDNRIADEAELIVQRDVYLPTAIVSLLEEEGKGYFRGLHGQIDGFDDMTTFFKTMVTVLHWAFVGRNASSNVLQSLLVGGRESINSIPKAMGLMMAPDHQVIRFGRQELTAKEWRQLMRDRGVLTDNIVMADIDTLDTASRVNVPRAAKAAALGAGAGTILGQKSGDEDDPLSGSRNALVGFLMGSLGGTALSAGFDVYSRSATKVLAKEAGITEAMAALKAGDRRAAGEYLRGNIGKLKDKKTWGAAFDQWLDDVGLDKPGGMSVRQARKEGLLTLKGPAKRASRLGAASGSTVGTAVAVKTFSPVSGAAAGAVAAGATGGTQMMLEGAVIAAGHLNRQVENQARIANFITGMESGIGVDASVAQVNRALFDYGDLTPFERYVAKRVFPFWVWSSRNVQLQAYLLKNKPGRYALMSRMLNASMKDALEPEDIALVPHHLRWRFVMSVGPAKLAAGLGLPIEDFVDLFRTTGMDTGNVLTRHPGLASRLSPSVMVALQYLSEHHLYYDKEIGEIRNARDLKHLPDLFKEYVGYYEFTDQFGNKRVEVGDFNGDGEKDSEDAAKLGAHRMFLLKSFPGWRLVSELNKALLTEARSGVQSASSDVDVQTPTQRRLGVSSGIKVYDLETAVDPDTGEPDLALAKARVFLRWEQEQRKWLSKEVDGFEITVLPKELQDPTQPPRPNPRRRMRDAREAEGFR